MPIKEDIEKIKAFVLDVDGVLTDGSVLLYESGEQLRRMNIKDGYAIQLAVKKGYGICVISGGRSEAVRSRFRGLGVQDVYICVKDKKTAFNAYLSKNGYTVEQVAYIGDDIPDYDVMQMVGFACCPKDSAAEIKAVAKYITSVKGGEGCVREVIEKVLRQHGNWFKSGMPGQTDNEFLW